MLNERLNQHRLVVYDLIARHAPLSDSLDAISALIEQQLTGARVSIMLFDKERQTLSITGGENTFSAAYRLAVMDLPIGPHVGTCGVAASTREMRITPDISLDPNWTGFHAVAEQEGLRACWSCPILNPQQELLGTFATYYPEACSPDPDEIELMQRASRLVALAISHFRERQTREQAETELRLLKRGIEASPNGVVIADAEAEDMPLIYANPAFYQISGYTPDEVIGRNCRFLSGKETDPAALDEIRQALAEQREVTQVLKNYRKDGTAFWNRLSINPLQDEQGHCTHFVGIQQDITRQRENEALLEYQARHDRLTGLPNWHNFEQRLQHDYQLSGQGHEELALLYINLDNFKPVNEGLGHAAGDQLLVQAACRMRELLQPGDMLTRISGDEFVLLLAGVNADTEAVEMAEAILAALSAPFDIDGQPLHISASIGITLGRHSDKMSASALVRQADRAMQQAKAEGRNTWYWYNDQQHNHHAEHLQLRQELTEAINQQQLRVYYQPVVSARSGHIVGVEALVRWLHPERGLVSPAQFIPVAEQTGQIIAVGRYVLQQACKDMARLYRDTGRVLPVSVNISPLQFRRSGFLDELRQVLARTELAAEQLVLEVTEGVLMSGTESSIELLQQIRELGVGVAIDDFGTGFSSLSYLRRLPVNKLKLDRSFICNITHNRPDAAIVRGVIAMAHHLQLQVVAEGIETEEQWQYLRQRRCDLLQGFLFAKPMPLDQLLQLPERLPA